MSDMLRICQSLMSHLCHWFNEPVSKNRIFTVQLLTSIVAGCKPAAPNPLFKSLVSGSQAICKTDKTRIPLLCGCLQRDTAFVVSEGQRPQGSGHLTWDCRGGILLIYTYNGLYSMCRRLKKMHFLGSIYKKAQHFQNFAISAQHKNHSATYSETSTHHHLCHFCTDLAVILYSPAKCQVFQFCECFQIRIWTDCRQWLHHLIFRTLVIEEAERESDLFSLK